MDRKLRIAIDFDETIFNRRTGEIYTDGIRMIDMWLKQGHEITIFTARPDREHPTVKTILELAGIQFHRLICGKPHYDLLIDDKAVKFEGWNKKYL